MKTYVINLDCRPERMAFMHEQLARLGLAYTRISAINGLNDPPLLAQNGEAYLSGPEAACYKSHLETYRSFLETDEAFALILEDDVHLAASLPDALEFIKTHGLDTEHIRLEVPFHSLLGQASHVAFRPHAQSDKFKLVQMFSDVDGTGAYIISRGFASRILHNYAAPKIPIDTLLLSKNGIMTKRPALFQLNPPQAIQDQFYRRAEHPAMIHSDLEISRARRWSEIADSIAAKNKEHLEQGPPWLQFLKPFLRNIHNNSRAIWALLTKPAISVWHRLTRKYEIFTYPEK